MADSIIVATLGGQAQIITLALDRLQQRIGRMHLIQLYLLNPASNPRYQQALTTLRSTFDHGDYPGTLLKAHVLRRSSMAIDSIDGADAADSIHDSIHADLKAYKAQGANLHILPTGGPRLLGMLLLSAAQAICTRSDRCWHLASSEGVRRASANGSQLHLPETDEIQLVAVPLHPLGQYLTPFRLSALERDPDAHKQQIRQRQVWRQLSARRREVLVALVRSNSPTIVQAVAQELHITPKTVDEHKTAIFILCRDAWEIAPEQRLSLTWLRSHFADFDPDRV